MDEELSLFMDLIRQPDLNVEDAEATRSGSSAVNTGDAGWQRFYKMVTEKKVTATIVIDFQYKQNETVERMYCFDNGGADRVVIHVHTLEQWPGETGEGDAARFAKAYAAPPATRARKVTSVNIRIATLNGASTGPKFLQGSQGCPVVSVPNWKKLVRLQKGSDTEWRWGMAWGRCEM